MLNCSVNIKEVELRFALGSPISKFCFIAFSTPLVYTSVWCWAMEGKKSLGRVRLTSSSKPANEERGDLRINHTIK
jgi:hypothetical protein